MQTQDLLLLLSFLHGATANQDLWWLDKGVFRDPNSSPDISINQRNNNNNNQNNERYNNNENTGPQQQACQGNCRKNGQKLKPQQQRKEDVSGNERNYCIMASVRVAN